MIPSNLQIDGLKFILIKYKEKVPIEKWREQNYSFNDEKLLKHIETNKNYGVVLGNAILVIDADTVRLNKIVKDNFPETFTVKTKKGFHYYYSCYEFKQKKVLKDEEGHLGEIQYKGQYVVAPNSIHPSGVVYEVFNDIPITIIDNALIEEHLSKYFTTEGINKEVILDGVSSGLRNEAMFKLACSFRNKDLTPEEAFETLKGLNLNNKPPLPIGELKQVVESAYSYNVQRDKLLKEKNSFKNLDNRLVLAEEFYKDNPFFYDRNCIFWFWNFELNKYEIKDEVDLMNSIDNAFEYNTINAKTKNEIVEALKRVGRKHIPEEPTKDLIQFKDKVFNIKTRELSQVTPNMFFTNPIPYDIGEHDYTPHIDRLFKEWVGEKYVQTLYEIVAYCCYRDYPIHLIFCFTGAGRNGKSSFQSLIKRFLGINNMSSTELDNLIDGRFETFKLYKKLVCVLGETNFGSLKKTSMLKKLVGQDLIGFEKKNKTPFDDYNYAKMIIASNSLPTSYDTSEGFYRRWMVINFPNKFPEGKDIIEEINDEEFKNLCKKILNILPELLERGCFHNQGTIEDRKHNYIMNSNPLMIFLENHCIENVDGYISYSRLYSQYVSYLKDKNQRIVSKKEFSKVLDEEGIEKKRTTLEEISDVYVLGYFLKEKLSDFQQKM